MKTKIIAVSLLMANFAFAGNMSSGGVPPMPRTILIQERPNGAELDAEAKAATLALVAKQMVAGKVQAFVTTESDGDRYTCIEYDHYPKVEQEHFKQTLADKNNVEVLIGNAVCQGHEMPRPPSFGNGTGGPQF